MPATDTHADRRARFEALWEAHHRFVLAFALRRTHEDRAADVAEETFAAAWRRLDEAPADARPWLAGIARGVLANERRAEGRRRALGLKLGGMRQPVAPDPADRLDLTEGRAFRRLSAADRDLLALVAWDGLTAPQAAATLGCSETALRVRLHRARGRLERLLAEERGETPAPTTRIQEDAP